MVDVSKIKPGDKVTVSLTFVQPVCGSFSCKSSKGYRYAIEEEDIVSHTPAQREIKVGDRVRHVRLGEKFGLVLCIDGDSSFVRWDSDGRALSADLDNLRHADEATS